MKIAIVGGGFTGLSTAVELVERGEEVTIFESEKKLGGLAIGFRDPKWQWSLERYYHHIFANDDAIIKLARKVGSPGFFSVPETNSFINGVEKRLDSPWSLLMFSEIPLLSRLHMGFGLLLFKLIPNGIFLENKKAVDALPLWLGREGYQKIWKPLLAAKFGPFLPEVNLAWFWARVHKRTQKLGYFEGGFQALADKIGEYIKNKGGKIKLATKVKTISQDKDSKWRVNDEKYDRLLITTPAPLVDKLIGPGKVIWPKVEYLFAQTLILELDQSLMKGYWLNILEKDYPFLVAVEHTNFIDKKYYDGKVIVYLGNYLSSDDKRLKMNDEQLIKMYLSYLKKINPNFQTNWIKRSWYFESPYAQPVFPINYSRQIPPMETTAPGLIIANMGMVYPWDRGTNYAVESGRKAAKLLLDS